LIFFLPKRLKKVSIKRKFENHPIMSGMEMHQIDLKKLVLGLWHLSDLLHFMFILQTVWKSFKCALTKYNQKMVWVVLPFYWRLMGFLMFNNTSLPHQSCNLTLNLYSVWSPKGLPFHRWIKIKGYIWTVVTILPLCTSLAAWSPFCFIP